MERESVLFATESKGDAETRTAALVRTLDRAGIGGCGEQDVALCREGNVLGLQLGRSHREVALGGLDVDRLGLEVGAGDGGIVGRALRLALAAADRDFDADPGLGTGGAEGTCSCRGRFKRRLRERPADRVLVGVVTRLEGQRSVHALVVGLLRRIDSITDGVDYVAE